MLKADTNLEVAGEVANFAETLELVDGLKPDIVVLDLHMPDERIYLPESVKLKVLESAGCILALRIKHLLLSNYKSSRQPSHHAPQNAAFVLTDCLRLNCKTKDFFP
jgi:DNA-binding NarL/FixJ family response regulator